MERIRFLCEEWRLLGGSVKEIGFWCEADLEGVDLCLCVKNCISV